MRVSLISGLAAVAAGTASATMLVPPPGLEPPRPPQIRHQAPLHAIATPAIEARRAPVPLVSRRQGDGDETGKTSGEGWTLEVRGLTEGDARAAISADGYRSVHGLLRLNDGRWAAQALRGQTIVNLTVDADGNVRMD
ncbi:MAG: hypothetical protein KIT25_11030 [Enhydrobacter sp.]|nr:MAG: hypothetical protein KIT25_11030 [Enhydrobacter sp.]